MTSQQRTTIQHIDAQLESDRFTAQQAAREVAELDPRGVLIAIEVKLAEGRYDEAKQLYLNWKASHT